MNTILTIWNQFPNFQHPVFINDICRCRLRLDLKSFQRGNLYTALQDA